MSTPNPYGGAGDDEGRGSWCTPKWLAEIIGKVDLDPCSNGRSHIQAGQALDLSRGDDGLHEYGKGKVGRYFWKKWAYTLAGRDVDKYVIFINPPYGRGSVEKWVAHWKHTRFIFLLRWDPSTEWFDELYAECTHVWFPPKRVDFEPPPGVTASSNPFPHALYLRRPPAALLERLDLEGYLLDVAARFDQTATDGRGPGTGTGGTGKAPAGGTPGGGTAAGGGGAGKAKSGVKTDWASAFWGIDRSVDVPGSSQHVYEEAIVRAAAEKAKRREACDCQGCKGGFGCIKHHWHPL